MDISRNLPPEIRSSHDQDQQNEISTILRVVERELGVCLSDYRQQSLTRRVSNRLKLAGCHNYQEYLALLEASPGEARRLLEYVTIKWSRFFRDEQLFERLKTQLLPDLMERRAEGLAVWSAGCAKGEEPYSVAILLRRMAPGFPRALILGTDVDSSALAAARLGIYSRASLEGVPEDIIGSSFLPEPGRTGTLYRLREDAHSAVRFLEQNLLSATCPPEGRAFDLVLCRNVLIYFDRRVHTRTFDLLTASLNSGGYLCLGEAEHLPASHSRSFDTVDKKNRIYRKR